MDSNAMMFSDALAARRWHRANNPRQTVPAALEVGAIASTYLIGAELSSRAIRFLDGSMATLAGDRWVAA